MLRTDTRHGLKAKDMKRAERKVASDTRKTFRQEYLAFLKRYQVPYDERYIFKPLEEDQPPGA